jgi:hypothetical protein
MRLIQSILFFSFLTELVACKKVIDIKVKESDTKYVIEGIITNEPGSAKVLLSRTNPFYADNNFPEVSGAVVKISDNGTEQVLTETTPGVYENNSLTGVPGHQYQLLVSVGGQSFTATCTMPQPVVLDTLYISPGPFGQFQFATIAYTDPAGINNGYRFVQYLNGTKDPRIFWENDEFTDGEQVETQLDTGVDKKDDSRNIKSGDLVTIEMQTLDEAVYQYWYSLRTGGGDGTGNVIAPANPLTNIIGGALGYFSAHTVNKRSVIAP